MPSSQISPQLKSLVKETVALFGDVVCVNTTPRLFQKIEKTRARMAALRSKNISAVEKALLDEFERLSKLGDRDLFAFAHAFALMLEVMNSCENAYRGYRLRGRAPSSPELEKMNAIFVLTAHPTEARSPQNVKIFERLTELLIGVLKSGWDTHRESVKNVLNLAWRLSITRQRKPRVEDEAEYIYSIVLNDNAIEAVLATGAEVIPVYLRSWVGGDKDGHPGVNEKTLRNSLALSRKRILDFACKKLSNVADDADALKIPSLSEKIDAASKALARLRPVSANDGSRVRAARTALFDLAEKYEKEIHAEHESISDLCRLSRVFPAFVIPLEIRESSDLVMKALNDRRATIRRMLRELNSLAGGGDPRWYVRGFIISMASRLEHLNAAAKLVNTELGALRIPVIPLFEEEQALKDAPALVKNLLRDKKWSTARKSCWENNFEVMLGYSDSSKEAGVLQSRLLIAETTHKLDRICRSAGATPLFFHGAGGSVDRGGGSLQEQTAWWPLSSLVNYKVTVQGEMVERTFSSSDVFRSQLEKLALETKSSEHRREYRAAKVLESFAASASAVYRKLVDSQKFLDVVEAATPYRYLSALRIGSRPAKRGKLSGVKSLRAIPWVLCWTQTRILLPTWFGVGTAWRNLDKRQRSGLRREFARDPLFRSYVKALGFTLAKVEIAVWKVYLEKSRLDEKTKSETFEMFRRELRDAHSFVRAMTGKNDLLWFRPWLGESIKLRSPMIHPLNLIQLNILRRDMPAMVRETVTGISNGMMTTG